MFNGKRLRHSHNLKEDLHVYTNLCDKLHKQHVSEHDKNVQIYFYDLV